ncbi:MAG: YidC/Oxa1 family membrane protein insertase [Atribacterota bacterium]|nr:YidC/Oxa1 family membrane protein insertase [Atribacterota bacterium]
MGIWSSLIGFVEEILRFLYGFTHNYGLAIILLTIIIRIVMYPLMQKQMTSMKETQKIQPLMQEIQKKYKNDKEMLNKELMRLYREHNVNPMGGCLPLIIQMPILILFFQVLREFKYYIPNTDIIDGGFLWIPNTVTHTIVENGAEITRIIAGLAAPEKLFEIAGHSIGILPILVGVTMYIQQKLTTPSMPVASQGGNASNPAANTQKIMTTVMPLMITFISFSLPSGLSLYWVISTVFGIGQQLLINKKDGQAKNQDSLILVQEKTKEKQENNKKEKQTPNKTNNIEKNTVKQEKDVSWIPGYENTSSAPSKVKKNEDNKK